MKKKKIEIKSKVCVFCDETYEVPKEIVFRSDSDIVHLENKQNTSVWFLSKIEGPDTGGTCVLVLLREKTPSKEIQEKIAIPGMITNEIVNYKIKFKDCYNTVKLHNIKFLDKDHNFIVVKFFTKKWELGDHFRSLKVGVSLIREIGTNYITEIKKEEDGVFIDSSELIRGVGEIEEIEEKQYVTVFNGLTFEYKNEKKQQEDAISTTIENLKNDNSNESNEKGNNDLRGENGTINTVNNELFLSNNKDSLFETLAMVMSSIILQIKEAPEMYQVKNIKQKLLLKKNDKDIFGRNIFFSMLYLGLTGVCEKCLEYGYDINDEDRFGNTGLHYMHFFNRKREIAFLKNRGAISKKNNYGFMPKELEKFSYEEYISQIANDTGKKKKKFLERSKGLSSNYPKKEPLDVLISTDSLVKNRRKIVNILGPLSVKGTILEQKLGNSRLKGVSRLPIRLNTFERILEDKELMRVFDDSFEFVPKSKKTAGSAIGNKYLEIKTKTLWLGKAGDGTDLYSKNNASFQKLSKEKKTERKINYCAIQEFIANNIYRVFGDGSFETPQMVLHYLPLMNEFLKDHFLVLEFLKDGIKNSVRVMIRWIDEYQNLSVLKTSEGLTFMEHVKKYKAPPSVVIEPTINKELKLKGIGGLLGASSSIGDIDVFGGTGENSGYILEKNGNGEVISARIIKIDPGFSFSFSSEMWKEFETTHKIPVSTHGDYVDFDNFCEDHKNEFLEVKRHIFELISNASILDYLFFRNDKFNRSATIKIGEKVCKKLIRQLRFHCEGENQKFSKELFEFEKIREEIIWKEINEENKVGKNEREESFLEKLLEIISNKKKMNLKFSNEEKETESKILNNLGLVYSSQGNYSKAIEFCEKSLSIQKKIFPENHPDIALSFNNLGSVYDSQGNYSKAIEFCEKSLSIRKKIFPENHPDIALSFNNLGVVYQSQGNYSKAMELFKKSLIIFKKVLPENHPLLKTIKRNIEFVQEKIKTHI